MLQDYLLYENSSQPGGPHKGGQRDWATFWAEFKRKLSFYDFNAPLQPFAWSGGLGVSGWSKLTLFWKVWGLAGALDIAAGWLDGILVAGW